MKCADCQCVPELCSKQYLADCKFCVKDDCCCVEIHLNGNKATIVKFFWNAKNMYASALAIEILCIMSAEIGQNSSFFLFGYKSPFGVAMSYILGYGLAGFTTFVTILGRYNLERVMDGCCSVLENENDGFVSSLKITLKNFAIGIEKIPQIYKMPDFRQIMRSGLCVLITGESVCILTAETVNLAFFRHALWLSIPLSLLAGAFAITIMEAYRKTKTQTTLKCCN
ncbi:MAG: hypothetical protein KGI27_03385 [Thaumarchaeota archaeon]|nr:hypothetical protein [Nitrososphaerota archaeon]